MKNQTKLGENIHSTIKCVCVGVGGGGGDVDSFGGREIAEVELD